MKLTNTSDFPDHFLRRMVGWCCRELLLPVKVVRQARFTKYRTWAFRGRAWSSGRILVRIGPEANPAGVSWYPLTRRYPGRVRAPEYVLADRIEALVKVTAHELAHLERWQSGVGRNCEGQVDSVALIVLNAFRKDREVLLAEWNREPASKEVPPKPSVREKNAAKVQADLLRWTRKLKLAQTKVRKLKVKAKRYERIAAQS